MLLHVAGGGDHGLQRDLISYGQEQLNAFVAGDLKYFSGRSECVIGTDPAAEIRSAAKRWNADLIMIPSHGLGTFRRLLLGSVVAKVLHDAECPVWTSIHAEEAPALENIHCGRVLCAIDLSPRSREILPWASWLAKEYGASLGIVHAVAPWPPVYYGGGLQAAFNQAVTSDAISQIAALKSDAGIEAEVFAAAGEPWQIVAGAAKTFGADILVTGRHSGSGLSQYVGQHAYSIIRHSPCPAISI